jgi:hypothetical protein
LDGNKELLAYCGFYCGDCLGYTGVIADAAQNMMRVLEKYKFDQTAECVFPEKLRDYDEFCEMLAFMTSLRCAGVCRKEERDSEPSGCEVKNCCRERGFYACYECDDFETCDKLKSIHKELHTDSCVRNMRAIREMGLEAWIARGRRFCYWIEADDCP